jgi:hypothetical protein
MAVGQKPEPLHVRIGRLREEARTTEADTASGREELNEVDGAIRLASHLAATGTKKGPERRGAMRDLRPGVTVGAEGVVKTQLTRAEKLVKVVALVKGWSEEQREQFMLGEKYAAMSENAQDVFADAIAQVDNSEFSTTDIANIDLEAEPVDIDSLPEDETEAPGDSFEVLEGEDVESFDVDDYEEPEV